MEKIPSAEGKEPYVPTARDMQRAQDAMSPDQEELTSERFNAVRNLKVETGKEGYLYWTQEANGEKVEGELNGHPIILERSNKPSSDIKESTYSGSLEGIALEPGEAEQLWVQYHNYGIPKKREDEIIERLDTERKIPKKEKALQDLL